MSHLSTATWPNQRGATLIELLVVIMLTLVVAAAFYTFFKTNLSTYLNLQKDASGFTDLAVQSQRIGNVVRGLTDIITPADNDMVFYGYFFPTDTYVSLVHYYRDASGTILYADVTPMTANPPVGTPISADKKTYTIMDHLRLSPGTPLFQYQDSAGATMTLPIADQHTIKGVQVNLAVAAEAPGGNQAMNLQVSLRNRKTNL